MKLGPVLALVVVAVLAIQHPGRAQDARGIVDFVGTWKAVKIQNLMWHGGKWDDGKATLNISVTEQEGPVFRGVVTW